MSYDLAFRFQQALDPSALMDIAASLHAIEAAITDSRNAGIATESDPAIILLCRHLATVCADRSEEHTSELQSLMRISYAVFCLKKKNKNNKENKQKVDTTTNIHTHITTKQP